MTDKSYSKSLIMLVVLISLVVGLSLISNRIWGGRHEVPAELNELKIEKEMTVAQFGRANELPNNILKEIFGLKGKSDLEKKLGEYGTAAQISSMVNKKLALATESASKNWIKIPLKFALWFAFLSTTFISLRNRKVTAGNRKRWLFTAVLIFGVILGADPSPMGTVKDAIRLYGTAHVIYPPRMIALSVFLTISILVNKYICAWGCQVGTLQDLIFHINQTDKRKSIIGKQIKLPFALTNSIRVLFLFVFTLVAFLWAIDIIEPIDPFKIFKPAALGLSGGVFAGLLVLASLFIYRPWCHFCCPFGIVGWFVEKFSLVKISVDYESCIACQKCSTSCPSTVMDAILRCDKKTIPDCFSCYTCRDVCPTGSISFSTRARTSPPADHFDKRNKS